MRARVIVRRKPGVLDPQGEAVRQALGTLGFEGVGSVRIGKVIDVEIDGSDPAAVKQRLAKMADELLANPVMETFTVEVEGENG